MGTFFLYPRAGPLSRQKKVIHPVSCIFVNENGVAQHPHGLSEMPDSVS